jgi:hypothetical protein
VLLGNDLAPRPFRGAGDEQPFEVELGDRRKGRQILERRTVDDVEQRPFSVEQLENAVELVGDLVQPLEQLRVIDVEHRHQGWQLLEQASPLVDPPHPLHQDPLRRHLDDVVRLDDRELDLERTLVPDERAVNCFFAAERAELRVDDLSLAKQNLRAVGVVVNVQNAALSGDLERLQKVDDGHVLNRALELGSTRLRLAGRDPFLRPLREKQIHARDQLAHENWLREVVLHAELEPADLVFNRLLARQKDDGDGSPFGALFQPSHERVPVHARESRVGQDEVGRRELDFAQCIGAVSGRRDAITGFFEADFEDPHAARVGVDQEELLLRQASPSDEAQWRRPE